MVLKFIGFIVIIALIASFTIPTVKLNTIPSAIEKDFVFDTIARGLTVPWEIVFLPDKTMMFTERNGKVRLFRNNQLVAKPALALKEIDTTKKMGLLGMCLHPQFTKNHYLYLSYNYRKENVPLLKIVRYQLER